MSLWNDFNPASPKNPMRLLRGERGMALQLALTATLLLMFLVTQISRETITEYLVSRQELQSVQAYHAAEACTELSLLRIKTYQYAAQALSNLSQNMDMTFLDMVWQFPFSWPPMIPDEMSLIDKSELQGLVQDSSFKFSYSASISSEGSRIDINDLGSEITALHEATYQQIMELFNKEVENNETFSERYRGYRFDELVKNIADWVDSDTESRNGGDERTYYRDVEDNDFVPPNQPFKTLQELHMVAGMRDDFYNVLAPRITVYGTKAININHANEGVLMSLSPQITQDLAQRIIQHRQDLEVGGPFKDRNEFYGFIGGEVDTSTLDPIPLTFDPEINFRIECVGRAGNVTRKIVAIVYDFDRVKERYSQALKDQLYAECKPLQDDNERARCECEKEQEKRGGQLPPGSDLNQCIQQKVAQNPGGGGQSGQPSGGQGTSNNSRQSSPITPGRPNVVYWIEE